VSARIDLADLLGRRRRFDEGRGLLVENLRALGAGTAPGRAGSLYRLARIDVAQADKAAAMKHVRESIDAGLDDATGMSSDPALSSLRGPAFDDLVARARRNFEERNAARGPGR
jgi:hypothetical protein